jgi:hypothetical protein
MIFTHKLTRLVPLFGALLLSVAFTTPAHAKTTCRPAPGGQLCTSEVDFARFAQTAFRRQDMSQWCWAASISMLYSYYGHPVSQERIVTSLYGRVVNLPSFNGYNIATRLNMDWVDDRNERFRSRITAAYDHDAGVNNLNNAWLVNELHEDRPFVVGTNNHAVVATAVQYYPTPMGPNVIAIGVFDPWPGRGARGLTPVEMTPMIAGGGLRFIATVRVSDL